jgi:hypothetical protein
MYLMSHYVLVLHTLENNEKPYHSSPQCTAQRERLGTRTRPIISCPTHTTHTDYADIDYDFQRNYSIQITLYKI